MDNIFSLLDSFGLNDPPRLGERLLEWGEEEFQRFFEGYSESAKTRPIVMPSGLGSTDVFPDSASGPIPLELIRQLCLYANRLYIHDPILLLEDDFLTLDTNIELVMRWSSRAQRISQFRSKVERKITDLLAVRPLAEAGILHVTPTAFTRNRREPGAVYATEMYGPSGQYQGEGEIQSPVLELPPGLSDYINEHLVILPVRFENGRPIVIKNQGQKPTNSIAVQFDDGAVPTYFCLMDVKLSPKRKLALETRFDFDPSEDALDTATFRHWVLGESQKYIRRRLADLHIDLYLSSLAGAHFLTSIPSSKDLATVSLERGPSPNPVLNTFLKLQLPFLSGVSLQELADARKNEAAFNDFRVALDKAFREIESLGDEERQRTLDEIARDIIHAPLARIDKRMNSLSRDVFVDAALAIGTLVTNFVSGGNTLLTLAFVAAAAKALESYKKDKSDQDKIREHPSFFYWEATKGARKRAGKNRR